MDLTNIFDDVWRNPFTWMLPFVVYAETHYSFKGVYSRLKKREPELIVDAPHRVEPGRAIPILVFMKDSDQFPASVVHVEAQLLVKGKAIFSRTWMIRSPEYCQKYVSWVLNFDVPHKVRGAVQVDVTVTMTCDGKTRTYHNDNYRISSHEPLNVFVADERLPRTEGWYYGDMHCHTSYSEDQVEFGAPVEASAQLSRAMGLDFFAATDHSYDLDDYIDNYLKNDPDLLKWQQYQHEIDRVNQDNPDFVVIPGEEVSAGNSANRNVHFLILNHPEFIPGKGDGAERWFRTRPDLRIPDILDQLGENTVAIAAHPETPTPFLQWLLIRRGRWTIRDYQHDRLDGMQFWNGVDDGSIERDLKHWVQLLLAGKRRFIVGGTDAHGNFNRFRQIGFPFWTMREHHEQVFGTVRTAVYVQGDFTLNNVLQALCRGRCLMTDGPFVDFYLTDESGTVYRSGDSAIGHSFTLSLKAKSSAEFGFLERITLYCGDLKQQTEIALELLNNKKKSHTLHLTIPWENSSEGGGYMRVECSTRTGRKCYTNPVWLIAD
ncbi:CehA/McbA family metallohydrolase [candidate division KSB1 bacterium]|nr:CehA/McbA family metallohydrolase [candidate division KSB1 bacterium]